MATPHLFHIHVGSDDETDDSQPVLLSNGKPLKSSLKSSSSAPEIIDSTRTTHLRARSAPSTPTSSLKNVHFAEEKHHLESVRLFNRSAKPASLSSQNTAEDTETDTEIDQNSFPFPRIPSPTTPQSTYQLDSSTTSSIPSPSPSPYANIHLESITLPASQHTILTGSLIVRNIAYEKHVAVRFTVDDWQTTSEVLARHVASLQSLPPTLVPRTVGDAVAAIARSSDDDAPWDRFTFTIRLEDYAFKLHEKVLWLVARYTTGGAAPGAGEWWDNNNGKNYKVGFKPGAPSTTVVGKRAVTISAPPHLSVPNSHISFYPAPVPVRTTPPTSRLGKLSLLNYAAPSRHAPTLTSPPSPPLYTRKPPPAAAAAPREDDERTPVQSPSLGASMGRTIVGGQPASGFGYGVTLHWPWGAGVGADTDAYGYAVHLEEMEQEKEKPPGGFGVGVLESSGSTTSESESESDSASISSVSSVSGSGPAVSSAFAPPSPPLSPGLNARRRHPQTPGRISLPSHPLPQFQSKHPHALRLPSPRHPHSPRSSPRASPPLDALSPTPTSKSPSPPANPPQPVLPLQSPVPVPPPDSIPFPRTHTPGHSSPIPTRSFLTPPTYSPPPIARLMARGRKGSPVPVPGGEAGSNGRESGGGKADGNGVGSEKENGAESSGRDKLEADSDSVYKAFVRQWCFAQGPPPAVGGSGGLAVR